jgi:hypothetical protein
MPPCKLHSGGKKTQTPQKQEREERLVTSHSEKKLSGKIGGSQRKSPMVNRKEPASTSKSPIKAMSQKKNLTETEEKLGLKETLRSPISNKKVTQTASSTLLKSPSAKKQSSPIKDRQNLSPMGRKKETSDSKANQIESVKKLGSPKVQKIIQTPSSISTIQAGSTSQGQSSIFMGTQKPSYIRTRETDSEPLQTPENLASRLSVFMEELKNQEDEYLNYVSQIRDGNLEKETQDSMIKKRENIINSIQALRSQLLDFSMTQHREKTEGDKLIESKVNTEGSIERKPKNTRGTVDKRILTPKNNRTQTAEFAKTAKVISKNSVKAKTATKTAQSSLDVRRSRNMGSNGSVHSSEKKQAVSKNLGYIYNTIISNSSKTKKERARDHQVKDFETNHSSAELMQGEDFFFLLIR